jgi:D-gamma-glutamyl-meso-diaminopimelic acid endopeptidase CwlS/peptidoglycan endopeptidase LytF
MADIPPINPGAPAGAEPMKKSTGRVQPKKETVRINLPPKPTAAPTIKLPTLPPGGPTGAPSAAPAAPTPPTPGAAPLRSTATPAAPARPATAAAPASTAAPAKPRPAAAPVAAAKISTLDKILAIAAAVVGLVAIGLTVWMMMILNAALSS